MNVLDISREYTLQNMEGINIQAGTLNLKVQRISLGWGFLYAEQPAPYETVNLLQENAFVEVSTSNLYQTGKSNILVIAPALPPRPLVLKNSGMRIFPGQSMRFFVKIPLWLQFYFADCQPENFIAEFPLYRLSGTWFGEPEEGEPALALGNFYQKEMSLLDIKPWEAICPIHISNHSNLLLEVERFIIRVENLALVSAGGHLMTSFTEIEYKGKDQVSSASYHITKAVHGDDYQKITSPRNTGSKSSLKINFHFIKNIYQF
jgi:hypothetical protein